MATMLPGALVTLSGISGKPKVVGEGTAVSLNGMKAQLIEYVPEAKKWVASTFSGEMIGVDPKFLKPLDADGLDGFDFVMGPGTNPSGLAECATEVLCEKGYCTINVILSEKYCEEIVSAVQALEASDGFSRMPRGFDTGYLGVGGKGKTLKLAGPMPSSLGSTQLPSQENNMTVLSEAFMPFMKDAFGFTIQGKMPAMLSMPITSLEDEVKYFASPPTNKEADQFLALMARRKMCMLQFLGPGTAKMKLTPKGSGSEVTVDLKPSNVVLVVGSMYDFSYETSGEAVMLSSWFISDNNSYRVTTSGTAGALSVAKSTLPAGLPPPRGENYAVTGIGARDPCNVNTEEAFWSAMCLGGVDGFQAIPYSRFDIDTYIDFEDQQRALMTGKSYCRHQGHVDGLDYFDGKFFNIPDVECWGMDPCQRIVCEVGWAGLQSAGFDAQTLRKDAAHVGCYIGISGSDWPNTYDPQFEFPKFVQSPNGIPETFIANRFSFVMNLKGPSFIANTACSASLVAINNAKGQMKQPFDPLEGALCGGINLNLSEGTWIGNCAGSMLSFIGRSFSFSNSADGYGRGEGSSSIYIKREEEFNKNAFASVAGSNANSDGRSASLTAPNGPAQQRLLRAILEEVKITISECDHYEAHGTGTSLGDPIELGAVIKVLGKGRADPLSVSCHKGNFGHLEGGAGISGFIKVVQQIGHLTACPINHLNILNPNITLDGFPGLLPENPICFRTDSAYCGVSGFGYGGTNAHAMAYGKKHAGFFHEKATDPRQLRLDNLKKVRAAPPPEINATADSFEEWTTTGIPHLTAKPDGAFYVELLPGGKTNWREIIEPDAPEAELVPFIQGSFNGWSADMLEPSESVDGMYTYEVDVGASGEESFQIVLDADPDLALFPMMPMCSKKAIKVVGPDVPPSQEFSWVIKGAPETTYRVEVFISDTVKTVSWVKTE